MNGELLFLGILLVGLFGSAFALGASGMAAGRKEATAILAPVAAARSGSLDKDARLRFTTPGGESVCVSVGRNRAFLWAVCEVTLVPPALPTFGVEHGQIGALDVPLAARIWTYALANGAAVKLYESILCDGKTLTVKRGMNSEQRIEWTTEQVGESIDFALQLARFDAYGMRVLESLPEAVVTRDAAGFIDVELPGPSPVHLGPVVRDDIARTSAWTAIATAIDPDAAARVVEVGATLETRDHEVRIWWPTIEVNRERLLGAIEVLRKVARGTSHGAFR